MTYKCDSSANHKAKLSSKIIEVATDMFMANGIKAVKMDDVSKELGMSKRTLYEFFSNKETLLLQCVINLRERQISHIKDFREKHPSSTEIELIVEHYRYQMLLTSKVSTMFVKDLKKYPTVIKWMNDVKEQNKENVQSFIQGGIRNGYFRKDVNFDLIMELNDLSMENAIQIGILEKYGLQQVFRNVTMLYVRGFCTLEGIEELEKLL